MTNISSSPGQVEKLKYIVPSTKTLCHAFNGSPQIHSFINWYPELNKKQTKWLKRPIQNTRLRNQHLTLSQAVSKSTENDNTIGIGLVCNDEHQYIALDIDGVKNSHSQLAAFLAAHPTYQEHSPSGKPGRTRLLYKVFSCDQKSRLRAKATIVPEYQTNEIELYSSSGNYITLTGQCCSKEKEIQFIDVDDFLTFWPEFSVSHVSQAQILQFPGTVISPKDRATLIPGRIWTETVSCDRDNKVVKKFMGQEGYAYYDYWLLGLMSLHATFGEIEGFKYANDWSMTSADYNKADLEETWRSLGQHVDAKGITSRTYMKLFYKFTIIWPVPYMSKGKPTSMPIHFELSNFKTFLIYIGLTPQIDDITKNIFLDGSDLALFPKYYNSNTHARGILSGDLSRLAYRLKEEAEHYKFRPSVALVKTHLRDITEGLNETDYVNRFAKDIEKHTWDGVDRLKVISTNIIQRNPDFEAPTQEFQDMLVKKWCLSLARHFWPEELRDYGFVKSSSEGMLVLSGKKGGTGKSSFGMRMFPEEWQHLHIQVDPKFSSLNENKDYKMKTSTKIIVDYDEAERILGPNDMAAFKTEITSTHDTYRPPYGTDTKTIKRKYSHLASTNLESLTVPRDGARRVWWLNIKYIDTYALDKMDKYQIWAQIRHELATSSSVIAPWLLTSEEIKILERQLKDCRNETSNFLTLEEAYDFADEDYVNGIIDFGPNLSSLSLTDLSKQIVNKTKTLKAINRDLNQSGNLAALKHAVKDFLSTYAPDKVTIGRKVIKKGIFNYNGRSSYYMPPLIQDDWDNLSGQ